MGKLICQLIAHHLQRVLGIYALFAGLEEEGEREGGERRRGPREEEIGGEG